MYLFYVSRKKKQHGECKHFLHTLSWNCAFTVGSNNYIGNYMKKTEGLLSTAKYPPDSSPPQETVLVCLRCYNKMSQTRGLKQKTFISFGLEARKSKIGVPPQLGSGESSFSVLQMAASLVCLTWPKGRRARSLVSSSKNTNPITGEPPTPNPAHDLM